MQFSIVALFVGTAAAIPATLSAKLAARDGICSALLYSIPMCCSADVLNCNPPSSANGLEGFRKAGGAAGALPRCCTITTGSFLCKDV
ncbi:Hydrophobin 2 [Cordyceps fumosorosea ARSEF 2679]|uniref:Hydrophobin 2 n=1 Tax=Cordyceps fumosorosea (strain ARSEF 2679) TaxID=1081104 RepID=A0A167PBN5_CORFA|nr:Hydrophobin 2 [Cordyceps fumosorosea ARSEF 2679]OAA56490.1 Hydrophobin 2 [Cordyceps fumosorosea ARSEF 2679]